MVRGCKRRYENHGPSAGFEAVTECIEADDGLPKLKTLSIFGGLRRLYCNKSTYLHAHLLGLFA